LANSYFAQYSSVSGQLRFLINDIGMAFLLWHRSEGSVRSSAARRPLDSLKKAAMPIMATMGGMIHGSIFITGAMLLLQMTC